MSVFLTNIVTYHLSSIAIICALPIIINSRSDLNIFLSALTIIFVLNSILTILQFNNSHWAWAIGQLVNNGLSRELEANSDLIDSGNLVGRTITAGLTGFVVTNGYFTSTFLPISVERFHENNFWNFIGLTFIMILTLIVVYANQERSSMVLVLVFMVYYFTFMRKVSKTIPFVLLFFIVFYFLSGFIQTIDWGRLENLQDAGRISHIEQFISYLSTDKALFGGFYHYIGSHESNQHNCLLAAWTMGGIFTFVSFSVFFFYSIHVLLSKTRLNYRKKFGITPVFLAVSCLIYHAYSLTHSSGVHNDGMMFWIPYVLLLSCERIVKSENRI